MSTHVSNYRSTPRFPIGGRTLRGIFMALIATVALSLPALAGPKITFELGRASRDCTGFGLCRIIIDLNAAVNPAVADAMLHGDQLTLAFEQPISAAGTAEPNGPLVIEQPITLDAATARRLGVEGLTIMPGQYEVDYSSNPNGTVVVNAQPSGLTIHVVIGQRYSGCRGFGLCRIDIGPILSDRAIPAAAGLNGNTLTLQFLQRPADAGNALVIDEDIVLSEEASRMFGAGQLVVKRGVYLVNYNENPNGTVQVTIQRISITIHVEVGRKSRDCRRLGICSISIDFDFNANATARLNGNRLTVNLPEHTENRDEPFVIDEDIVLDAATSRALGAERVKVLAGTYPVDYSSSPNGTVTLSVQRIGITIEVEIGRPRHNCTGFGICSITIGTATERSVPAVASLDGNTLRLRFDSAPRGQKSTLTIDDDFELDPTVARMLGAKSVTVLKGEYDIAIDETGVHVVELSVARIGIGITITIGRASVGCERFGICRITLGLDFARRSTQAIASVENGMMEVDFLGGVPEHDSTLVIDDAIELDEASAAALGASTILPGAYDIAIDEAGTPQAPVKLHVRKKETSSVATSGMMMTTGTAQAHPNPTAGSTTIRFSLSDGGPVTATLHDAQGRKVLGLLDNTMMTAGEQSIGFDATSLTNGLYFYTIRSASGSHVGSVTVVK